MMTPDLPDELLEEILCRVPATSLKQLRSTCKKWNRLFNDTRFSRKHFDKAQKQLLLLTFTEKSRVCLLNVNLHNGTPSAEVTGELNLNDQVYIDKVVSHCDGLLLFTIDEDTRIVVGNPCTGQTKWIQTGKNRCPHREFVLGYYQADNKSCDKSYKILSYKGCGNQEFELYDINSNSWRNLDVTRIPDYDIVYSSDYRSVFLKGKTYWFAYDSKEEHIGLIRFDYTRERFERLRLPYQCHSYKNMSISVVGEEKLSVLLQRQDTSRREIWVAKKIDDETKEMSWSKLVEVELGIRLDMMLGSFLVDEEKKIVVCCEQHDRESKSIVTVSIVGEDSNATREYFPVKTMSSSMPFFVDYVPSLIQLCPSFIMFIRAS